MEDRFHDGLQVPLDDFLGNPVRDRRDPQWAGSPVTFGNLYPFDRVRPRLCENSRVQFARRKFFSIWSI